MLAVVSLVAIDLIVIISYTLVEGLHNNLNAKLVSHKERPFVIKGVIVKHS